jgi:ABC-type multidrug transport system ATPase subunit
MLVGKLTSTDKKEMHERIMKLIGVLGLTMKQDVLVKNLSGGEVKRVSVGIGMVRFYVFYLTFKY